MKWTSSEYLYTVLVFCANRNNLYSYRAVPTFGRDTIRKFSNNCSEMKQMPARDFEDLLQVCQNPFILSRLMYFGVQCAIPVFAGLLPEPHNSRLLELLFVVAQWHGLAKLRIHTDHTLEILDQFTTLLGKSLRDFLSKTCLAFDTKELPREANARRSRKKNKNAKESQDPATPDDNTGAQAPAETSVPQDAAPVLASDQIPNEAQNADTILASDQTLKEPENATAVPPSTHPPGILLFQIIHCLWLTSLAGSPLLPATKKRGKKGATSKPL